MPVISMRLRGVLLLQHMMGRVAVFILAPIYFAIIRLMGYRIRNLKQIREKCTRHFASNKGPLLVCANHLTMVDSLILTYTMLSMFRHMTHYEWVPWNLPERKNFQKNIILTVLCYLAKCIPINRGGSREEMKETLDQCSHLLECRQALLIFPEGGRSRTGIVNRESFSYGVGRFVKDFPDCSIMCIYLRGDGQRTYSSVPKFGEHFTATVEFMQPQLTTENGLRAQRDYAEQIINRLANMEEAYFNAHRQRHCGSDRSGEQGKESEYAVHQPRFHLR